MHGHIALLGDYEHRLTRVIADKAKQGGLFVDVGANAGYFTLLWANALPSNKVISFEPSPRNVHLLESNVKTNGFDDQVRVIAAGAGSASGEFSFDPGPEQQTGWGGFSLDASKSTIQVPVTTLDSQIDETIDLLKVDVEGAELWVLEGARRLLASKQIKAVVFENNPDRSRKLNISDDAVTDFLTSHDYTVESLDPDTYIARPR